MTLPSHTRIVRHETRVRGVAGERLQVVRAGGARPERAHIGGLERHEAVAPLPDERVKHRLARLREEAGGRRRAGRADLRVLTRRVGVAGVDDRDTFSSPEAYKLRLTAEREEQALEWRTLGARLGAAHTLQGVCGGVSRAVRGPFSEKRHDAAR